MDSSSLGDKILEGELRRLPVGLVRRARPGRRSSATSPATSAADCPTRGTATRSTTRMYAAAERGDRRGERVEIVKQMQQQLYEDSPYIVTAYTTHRRGRPQRPVRLLPAAARPGRGLAGPVRRPQLHAAAAGRGRRRLRRRRPRRIGASKQAPAIEQRRRGSSADGYVDGRGILAVLRRSAAASCCCGGGRRRPTGSDRAAAHEQRHRERSARPSRSARPRSYGRYVADQGRSAPCGSLVFVLVVNFFLFRVLPGDPARTLGRGRLKSAGGPGGVPDGVRPRPAAAPAVPHLPQNTFTGHLGDSLRYRVPVSDLILDRMWPTLLLVGTSTILAMLIGVWIGIHRRLEPRQDASTRPRPVSR